MKKISAHLLLPLLCLLVGCSKQSIVQTAPMGINYYTQGNTNRTAAEWEPAKGTMITWPLCVPYKLAVELAKDNHLYALVDNEAAKQEATKMPCWSLPLEKTNVQNL